MSWQLPVRLGHGCWMGLEDQGLESLEEGVQNRSKGPRKEMQMLTKSVAFWMGPCVAELGPHRESRGEF